MLKLGDKGEAVRCWERAIGLEPTGKFDLDVQEWTQDFQRKHGLFADGIVGPKTWAAATPISICHDRVSLTHWGVRKGPIEAIVVHHSCTSNPASTARILESRKLSTHFEVSTSGQVYQYGDPLEQVAWHCGGGVNGRSIGIDVTHMPGKPWPAVQVAALHVLLAWLCRVHGLPAVTAPDKSLGKGGLAVEWGVYRHRNLAATACPQDCPLP